MDTLLTNPPRRTIARARRISVPLFALTYLPAAMIVGAAVFVVLVGLSLSSRGSPTPCADTVTAAIGVSVTFALIGSPMIALGTRALASAIWGGGPVWSMIVATWGVAVYDTLRCKAVLPLPRLPIEILPLCALVFVALTFAVFFIGLWRLTHMPNVHPLNQRSPI